MYCSYIMQNAYDEVSVDGLTTASCVLEQLLGITQQQEGLVVLLIFEAVDSLMVEVLHPLQQGLAIMDYFMHVEV